MKHRAPALLYIPALFSAAGMLIPLAYLIIRTGEAQSEVLASLMFRSRTLMLLSNTFSLALGVLSISLLISFPLAWLTERTNIRGKKFISLLGVMPLALPGYVAAYALLSIGGNYGLSARLLGLPIPRISGYWGAAAALSLYSFPYLFLNIRTALAGLDPSLEETARSMGCGRTRIFFSVILPNLRPALLAGSVIIILYVLGDFGVVALMRYEVFSYAIYTQYTGAFDRTYAAALSLMLVLLASLVLTSEALLLRKVRASKTGSGIRKAHRRTRLGPMTVPAYIFAGFVAAASVLLPMTTLVFWMLQLPSLQVLPGVIQGFMRSAGAALPAAGIAVLLAVPTAYLHNRYPGPLSQAAERSTYIGYAVPPLALGLAFVFFSIRVIPGLYQTLPILILAYSLNFLALAMGPVRSSLHHIPKGLEEAARSFGCSPPAAAARVTLPLLKRSMLASLVLVFVMAMKELPIALLLSPPGYTTLSTAVFSRTSEGMFAEAAPFAAAIVILSSVIVGITLRYEGADHASA